MRKQMEVVFQAMDEASARMILNWRYEPPYDYYNSSNIDEEVQNYLKSGNAYYSVFDAGHQLIGYCCFGKEGQVPGGDYQAHALDIGLGLRPDLTGKGHGREFMAVILDFASQIYALQAFRVTVAAFNARAIRLYENIGFRRVMEFASQYDGKAFILMMREASVSH